MALINGLALLLLFQLAGEVAVRLLDVPVPGPVAGMLLLFVALCLRGGGGAGLEQVADGLLRHLSLLFVPAGVGLMIYLPRLAAEWLPITVALVVSTLLTLATCGLLLQALLRRSGGSRRRG